MARFVLHPSVIQTNVPVSLFKIENLTPGIAVFGLTISVNVLMVFVVLLPTSLLFIAIGLLAGSILTDKQVGGVCGALLTNLAAWLSGTWFDSFHIFGG